MKYCAFTIFPLLVLLGILPVAGQSHKQELFFDKPASSWEKEGLPIGNGFLGGVLLGDPNQGVLQFNVDSLWTGDQNPSGSYDMNAQNRNNTFGAFQNFGELVFKQRHASSPPTNLSNPSKHATTPLESIQASIDSSPQTKWCTEHHNRPVIWQINYNTPTQVTSYTLTSANDVPNRDPFTWKLEGSSDGKRWILIDQQRQSRPFAKRHETKRFSLSQQALYPRYRFTFLPREHSSHFQIAEIALEPKTPHQQAPLSYSRKLDIQTALHTTQWQYNGITFKRTAYASHPAGLIVWHLEASKKGALEGELSFKGAHPRGERYSTDKNTLILTGTLPNQLAYEARAQVLSTDGHAFIQGNALHITQASQATILLAADTNYVMDGYKHWKEGSPSKKLRNRLQQALKKSEEQLRQEHIADYQSLFNRFAIYLGQTSPSLKSQPINKRIANYRRNAMQRPRPCLDPQLEALLCQYGRYLLIASSRQGTLPANLQGIWSNSNTPAWHGDFHTNINLQMNYWLAESANLPELATPLFDFLDAGIPLYKKTTHQAYGNVPGFVTRMSLNPFGGGGWNWNIEGTAWLAQHYWLHYAFGKDATFLSQRAYPFMAQVASFWLKRLKKAPNGKLVVPHVWSHEHGPYEDGTAHAQQLMFNLFSNTLQAAKTLAKDSTFQQQLQTAIDNLQGPQIGSWGQLMEWMEEKPALEKSHHRHTSHLFAVFPGNAITLQETPQLAEAARISLTQRGEVGDSRRSWTWAWRTALWARLGDGSRAHSCVAGLLAYNTLPNLWTTHPPFQIDGNFGITAGIIEMLVGSQGNSIELLPALPDVWPTGSVQGVRVRGGHLLSLDWQDGALKQVTIFPKETTSLHLRYKGKTLTHNVIKGKKLILKAW